MGDHELPRECLFKIIVVGAASTGKTSIIKQFVQGTFSLLQKPTVGVDFASKLIQWDADLDITLQLWDIAGTM
jgi:GTPase SAR1 family protein